MLGDQSYVMKKTGLLKSGDFRVALQSVGIHLCMYLCHAMDPGNPEVTMLKEPISHLIVTS